VERAEDGTSHSWSLESCHIEWDTGFGPVGQQDHGTRRRRCHAGEETAAACKSLYEAVRRRFADDADATAKLETLAQEPEDEENAQSLTTLLAAQLASDHEFAAEIQRLVDKTTAGAPAAEFVNTIYGDAKIGQLTQIQQARDVDIGGDVTFN
jgi:hypothetical protein